MDRVIGSPPCFIIPTGPVTQRTIVELHTFQLTNCFLNIIRWILSAETTKFHVLYQLGIIYLRKCFGCRLFNATIRIFYEVRQWFWKNWTTGFLLNTKLRGNRSRDKIIFSWIVCVPDISPEPLILINDVTGRIVISVLSLNVSLKVFTLTFMFASPTEASATILNTTRCSALAFTVTDNGFSPSTFNGPVTVTAAVALLYLAVVLVIVTGIRKVSFEKGTEA